MNYKLHCLLNVVKLLHTAKDNSSELVWVFQGFFSLSGRTSYRQISNPRDWMWWSYGCEIWQALSLFPLKEWYDIIVISGISISLQHSFQWHLTWLLNATCCQIKLFQGSRIDSHPIKVGVFTSIISESFFYHSYNFMRLIMGARWIPVLLLHGIHFGLYRVHGWRTYLTAWCQIS